MPFGLVKCCKTRVINGPFCTGIRSTTGQKSVPIQASYVPNTGLIRATKTRAFTQPTRTFTVHFSYRESILIIIIIIIIIIKICVYIYIFTLLNQLKFYFTCNMFIYIYIRFKNIFGIVLVKYN